MAKSQDTRLPAAAGAVLLIVPGSGSSVSFSLALACATPFAALATASGLALRRGPALALVGAAWLANQVVGYRFLGYSRKGAFSVAVVGKLLVLNLLALIGVTRLHRAALAVRLLPMFPAGRLARA